MNAAVLSVLKTVVLLNIFVETYVFKRTAFLNKSFVTLYKYLLSLLIKLIIIIIIIIFSLKVLISF